MADQQPSVGRVVHYVGTDRDGQPQCWAALVTEVTAAGVSVATFPPPSMGATPDWAGVQEGAATEPGTWHWPERVP